MKINRRIAILTTVAVLSIAAVGTTFALFSDIGEATNVITMGKVNVELTEPKFSENTSNSNKMNEVVPNQSIEKDPTITVLEDSSDAYIRAKISFKGLTEAQVQDLEANIHFIDGWEKQVDGYYYFQTAKLTAGDSVVLFDSLVIPDKWGNEISSLTFEINIVAEAIQADNFSPREVNGEYGWYYSDNTPVDSETYGE